MKRETMEKWVLLDEAGELGVLRRMLLKRALARDADLHAWRTDLSGLRAWTRGTGAPVPETPRDVVAAILQAGERARGKPSVSFGGLRPVWAAAALLLFGAAAWLTQIDPTPLAESAPVLAWDDGLDTQMADIYARLSVYGETGSTAAGSTEELDAMAGELLGEGSRI